jgi:ring-1,2-phenylacetyl-CoA epoxidase subunit PaaC
MMGLNSKSRQEGSDSCLVQYTLSLADNALILGHRNSEWTGHGPVLEQDIAISNIALDLVGQARNFYQHAAQWINTSRNPSPPGTKLGLGKEQTEDTLAYLRDVREFKNCLLVEQENGDWANTTLRQFLYSAFQFLQFRELKKSHDPVIAATCEKALKEVTYHLRWSSEWVIRLGDGTEESHRRMEEAVDRIWKFTGELFIPTDYEQQAALQGWGIPPEGLREPWIQKIEEVFEEAGLSDAIPPESDADWVGLQGKSGIHTESLGYLLADMQFLQRAYPGCEW